MRVSILRSALTQLLSAANSAMDNGHTLYSRHLPRADSFTPAASSNADDPVAKMLTGFSSCSFSSTKRFNNNPIPGTRCASSITIVLLFMRSERMAAPVGRSRFWATSRLLSPLNQETFCWRESSLNKVVFPVRLGPNRTQALGGRWLCNSVNKSRLINGIKTL